MDFAAAFLDENRAFAEFFRNADGSTPVPTCPGWSLTQLLRHVGRGDRWAAQIVRDRLDDYLDPRAVEGGNLSVNSNTSVRVATPFGGFKQSGYGRELGPHALEAYTEVKSIFYATS